MILVLGIAILIVGTVLVFRAAKNNLRNAVLWSLLNLGVGIGLQFVIPFGALLFIAVFFIADGTGLPPNADQVQKLAMYTTFAERTGVLLSFVAMFVMLRIASRPTENGPVSKPPPPPEFG